MEWEDTQRAADESQSLWVRDRFLIEHHEFTYFSVSVAIPLGQGQVFNTIKVMQ